MPSTDHFEQAKSELAQDLHIVPYRVMGDRHLSPARLSSATSAQQLHTDQLESSAQACHILCEMSVSLPYT